jgi:hypothetical protein
MNVDDTMSPAMCRRHREMLIACSIIVLLSFLLHVPSQEKVTIVGLPNLPLPQTCLSKTIFGLDCPGCGLTRSFVCLAHGDWPSAWKFHRLGWLLAISVLFQFPYRVYALKTGKEMPLGHRLPKFYAYFLIAILFGNWLCRFL